MYVLRNCFDFFSGAGVIYLVFILLIIAFLFIYIYLGVSEEVFFSLFLNFISKLVMFLLYLISCKIYLFKVTILYCVILFWMSKKNFKLKKKDLHFFSIWVFFHMTFTIHRTAGEGRGHS